MKKLLLVSVLLCALCSCNSRKEYEWVDLGLSVRWATCNVGASSPWDSGNYYAWGEISTKPEEDYGGSVSYRKSRGDIGGNSSRDAATANWGGNWRLPTKDEFQELIDNCDWTWTTLNGHKGYKVTSKKNGNSIFLPAAGYCFDGKHWRGGRIGGYWSSTPYNGYVDESSYSLRFDEENLNVSAILRCSGHSVRPVWKD
jgi:uncharacterized protein (TIGR02145 family)